MGSAGAVVAVAARACPALQAEAPRGTWMPDRQLPVAAGPDFMRQVPRSQRLLHVSRASTREALTASGLYRESTGANCIDVLFNKRRTMSSILQSRCGRPAGWRAHRSRPVRDEQAHAKATVMRS